MKTKQIDYGIAENGLEAVEKWRTGNYHLVLVGLSLPSFTDLNRVCC